LKTKAKDFIEFQWKMSDSPEEPILLTVDANSSVVPDAAGGLTEIFECCTMIFSLFLKSFLSFFSYA